MYELINANKTIKNLLKSEYTELKKAGKYITFYLQFEELYELVKVNFLDFWNYIFKICERQRLNLITDYSELIDPIIFSNQKLLNILSSFKTYEDHLKHSISYNFSKTSEIYDNCVKVFSNTYNSNLSYHFMAQLRNHIQHFGLPIKQITYDLDYIKEDPLEFTHTISLKVDRDRLLNDKKMIKIKDDILKFDKYFDIKPFVSEYYNNINVIHSSIRKILKKDYDNSKLILNNLLSNNLSEEDRNHFFSLINPSMFVNHIKDKEVKEKIFLPYQSIERIDKLIRRNACLQKKGLSYSITK
ncbi:hypothetical protein D4R71_05020 [bacterium]|nr:MAG: hypothetical protein D4R71_05020 [bacterium]